MIFNLIAATENFDETYSYDSRIADEFWLWLRFKNDF